MFINIENASGVMVGRVKINPIKDVMLQLTLERFKLPKVFQEKLDELKKIHRSRAKIDPEFIDKETGGIPDWEKPPIPGKTYIVMFETTISCVTSSIIDIKKDIIRLHLIPGPFDDGDRNAINSRCALPENVRYLDVKTCWLPRLHDELETLVFHKNVHIEFPSPLPKNLKKLDLTEYNGPEFETLPENLKDLYLGETCVPEKLPLTLRTLVVSKKFNGQKLILPEGLKFLYWETHYELPKLPKSLIGLRFSNNYNSPLPENFHTECPEIGHLHLSGKFNQSIEVFPPKLHYLCIGDKYNPDDELPDFPKGLCMLAVESPMKKIPRLPESLRAITCCSKLKIEYLPKSVTMMYIWGPGASSDEEDEDEDEDKDKEGKEKKQVPIWEKMEFHMTEDMIDRYNKKTLLINDW